MFLYSSPVHHGFGQNGIMEFAFLAVRISPDEACINRKVLTPNKTLFNTAMHGCLK